MILKSLYALMATFGFGILFNIKGKKLILAACGGGIGWFFYMFSLKIYSSNLFAYFLAALAAGIYSEIMARLVKTPVTTFVICGIIPLVPGGGMYYTMFESIQGNVDKSLRLGLETLSIAGAIAIGVILVSSFTRVLTFWTSGKIKYKI